MELVALSATHHAVAGCFIRFDVLLEDHVQETQPEKALMPSLKLTNEFRYGFGRSMFCTQLVRVMYEDGFAWYTISISVHHGPNPLPHGSQSHLIVF